MFATDELFIRSPQRLVQEALLHVHEDHRWWPEAGADGGYGWVALDIPTGARGRRVRFRASIADAREWEGFRWVFEDGAIAGTGEFWFEAYRDGTIVHHYLQGATVAAPVARQIRDYRWAIRIGLNGLKDALERAA